MLMSSIMANCIGWINYMQGESCLTLRVYERFWKDEPNKLGPTSHECWKYLEKKGVKRFVNPYWQWRITPVTN